MQSTEEKIRMDKFLWAIRLYKTRALAAEACEKGRVKVAAINVKAGRAVKPGEKIIIHRGAWYQHILVTKVVQKRMSASLVKEFCEEITPSEESEKLRLHQATMAAFAIQPGAGRPTKKDRRQMDEFMGDW